MQSRMTCSRFQDRTRTGCIQYPLYVGHPDLYNLVERMNLGYFMFFVSSISFHLLIYNPFWILGLQQKERQQWYNHFVMLPFLLATLKRGSGIEDTKPLSISVVPIILTNKFYKQVSQTRLRVSFVTIFI